MNFKQVILENLNKNRIALSVKVLASKLQPKYTVAINNKKVDDQSYSIINDVDKDWSTIVFKFEYSADEVRYHVFIDNESRDKLIDVNIKTSPNNNHHSKLIEQGFIDLLNRLYKVLKQDEVGINQLKPVFEHIKQVEKYIDNDNKLLQKSNS